MSKTAILAAATLLCLLSGCAGFETAIPGHASRGVHNVKNFGATGDGKAIDTPAINRAIERAARNGGGTVCFPPGTYLCYTIRLKSNITLYLERGATILAADSPYDEDLTKYDAPEPNPHDKYQDFGHSHWRNSLIWGEELHDVAIIGHGMIDGKGLSRGPRPTSQPATRPATPPAVPEWTAARLWESVRAAMEPSPQPAIAPTTEQSMVTTETYPNPRDALPAGIGNKSIALKLCRNVLLRDITIYRGGHFCLLATGVDNLVIDNVTCDTNRDALDIDSCKNVRVSNCNINSPGDDGICLKSSYGLGVPRATENVTITNCMVSGYDVGTFIDGTFRRTPPREMWRGGPTGRIKFGTESNGGFKNITISNCVFSYCRGIALETVDGGDLEDVTISNITMRDVSSSAIFFRLGVRARGPNNPPPGKFRRIQMDNIVAYNVNPYYSSILAGIEGHDIEDVRLSNIKIVYQGGGPKKLATSQPAELAAAYPEPRMFGLLPASGFYIRHVKGLVMENIDLSYMERDDRPPFILDDVKDVEFRHVKAQKTADSPTFVLKNVQNFTAEHVQGVADVQQKNWDQATY